MDKNAIREWKCLVCGEIVKGENPPKECPVCKVGPDKFVEVESEKTTFRSQKDGKYIVIGGGIAGLRAAEAIRERNSVCSIEIISDEEVFCYNRPMLTKGMIAEFEADKFFSKQLDWYKENRIKTTLGVKVEAIAKAEKKIVLSNGEEKNYDKLIYALGAECNVPPMKGADKKGVEVIRKLSDVNKIRKGISNIENVVVIGGGILGLEAAWEFMVAGKKVTVIEVHDSIMGRQLDKKGSQMLKEAAERKGGIVSTGVGVAEIEGDEKVTGVAMEDGTVHMADMVVISAGVVPNAALAKESGLNADRFVEVNDYMQTSDENIYACGDVAAFNGVSIGIWPQAEAMGKVAGANAVGDDVVYEPITPSNSFEGFGTKIFSIGDIGHNPDVNYEVEETLREEEGIYRKVYKKDGKFCGAILMGDTSEMVEMLDAYGKAK